MCAEEFSTLINKAEFDGAIKGINVGKGGLRIAHLLFADDCVIFGNASMEEWKKLSDILGLYEAASG